MSLSDHLRGRDRQLSEGPSERDIEAETEEINTRYDIERDEDRDDTGEDERRKA
jgi:hypothetical protein